MKSIAKTTPYLIGLSLLLSAGASAQSEDTKAILDALKGLGSRMDNMQKQIDDIKKPSTASPPAPTVEPSGTGHPTNAGKPSVASPIAAGMRPEVGWVISVLPSVKGQREPDALFRFSNSRLPINFNAHLATRNIDDWVKYKGEAQLQIYEPGRHVFSVELNAPSQRELRCGGYLKIGKNVIIDLGDEDDFYKTTKVPQNESRIVSGGLTMEPGNYDISYLAGCFNSCQISGDEQCRGYWHSSSFGIQVRGPSDDAPRPFTSKEIIHMVRAKAPDMDAQSAKPAKDKPATTGTNSVKKLEEELPWVPKQ